VANPISDVNVDMNATPVVIDLTSVFSDAEDAFSELSLSASSSNTALVTTSLAGSELTLSFVSDATGTANVTVEATDTGGASASDVFAVNVSDPSVAQVLYRVNAGGTTVSGSPYWEVDTNTEPSPYRSEGSLSTNGRSITLSSSVPTGTPTSLFNTERYWNTNKPAMKWAFPVSEGSNLLVNIYLAETYVNSVGARVFDILIDGVLVDPAVDIVALAGGANIAIMRSYSLVSDGSVDISFGAITENPAIKAIEILNVGSSNARYFTNAKSPGTNEVPEDAVWEKTVSSSFDVKVYPNPFDGIINIEFKNKVDIDKLEIVVITDLGVSMLVEEIRADNKLLIIDLTTLHLSTSAYTLSIRDLENDKYTFKRIIRNE